MVMFIVRYGCWLCGNGLGFIVGVFFFFNFKMFRKDDVGYAPEQLPPPGVKRLMYWCGDECCFQISHDWDSYHFSFLLNQIFLTLTINSSKFM